MIFPISDKSHRRPCLSHLKLYLNNPENIQSFEDSNPLSIREAMAL